MNGWYCARCEASVSNPDTPKCAACGADLQRIGGLRYTSGDVRQLSLVPADWTTTKQGEQQ